MTLGIIISVRSYMPKSLQIRGRLINVTYCQEQTKGCGNPQGEGDGLWWGLREYLPASLAQIGRAAVSPGLGKIRPSVKDSNVITR